MEFGFIFNMDYWREESVDRTDGDAREWTEEEIRKTFSSCIRNGYGIIVGISRDCNPYFGTCGTTKISEMCDGHNVLEVRGRAILTFAKKAFILWRDEEAGDVSIKELVRDAL